MGELRKDYLLDEWVIISTARQSRPHEYVEEEKKEDTACFFCPGNEALTPEEKGRIPDKRGWRVRWFANKFAAVEPQGVAVPKTDNRFFTCAGNYGFHEIIVETPVHAKQVWDFSVKELEEVLGVYRERIAALERLPQVGYVSVFKNHGAHAGTSVVHAHSQVVAQAGVPSRVRQKVLASRRFVGCPYCAIIESERQSDRRIVENEGAVAFAPYASRFNYEVWVFPRQHAGRLENVDVRSVAQVLRKVFAKIKSMNWSFNVVLTYAPAGSDLHVHFEVCPRLATWAGYELGSGVIINMVSPEDAARWYRE